MSTYESMEVLGEQADTIANLLAAMNMPLPPQLHLDALRPALTDVLAKLRQVYVTETGDNPWHN